MKYLIFVLSSLILSSFSSSSLVAQFNKFESFEEVDSLSIEYFKKQQLDSAVMAMEYALENFPENEDNARFILGYLYTRTGKGEKALDTWKTGVEKGHYFGLGNNRQLMSFFQNHPEFMDIVQHDDMNGDSLNRVSHMEYELVLPEGFDPGKKYPVIFVFHGNGRNIEKARAAWNTEVIRDSFIAVYLQSYIHMFTSDFKWIPSDQKTFREFGGIFRTVMEQYPIDTASVILGGMSAGAHTALEIAFFHNPEVDGLILNCPVIPDNISNTAIKKFAMRRNKLVIITGQQDFALDSQKELIKRLQFSNVDTRFLVNPGMGHGYSHLFPDQLKLGLSWLVEN